MFNKFFSARFMIISAMGIGLGLGMSLVVFQNPQPSFASPVPYQVKAKPGITVSEFKIPNLNIAENNMSETFASEGLGKNKLAIIKTEDKNLIKNLEKVLLGEKILTVGSNNGLYVFTAIETRLISKSELNKAISFYDEGIIIYGQKSWISDELVLVVAK